MKELRAADIEAARRVGRAQDLLGPLYPWFERTAPQAPVFRSRRGAAVVLYAGEQIPGGFALPVEWNCDPLPSSTPGLPQSLLDVADAVRSILARLATSADHPSESYLRWSLRIDPSVARQLHPDFAVESESAALPLAIALALAQRAPTLAPAPWLLATGRLDEHGNVLSVGGYEDKLAWADRILQRGPDGRRRLALPRADEPRAREALGSVRLHAPIEFEPVDSLRSDLHRLLALLAAEPSPDASVEALLEFANHPVVRAHRKRRSDFYCGRLARELAERLRQTLPTALRDVDALLLPVSESADNALLSIATLRPRRVALLATAQSQAAADRLVRSAPRPPGLESIDVHTIPIDVRDVDESDVRWAEQWLRASRRAAVDLTPGTRELMLLLVEASLRTGALAFYIKTDSESGLPLYGTERIRLYDLRAAALAARHADPSASEAHPPASSRCLVNLTNHPIAQWPESQRAAALERFTRLVELPEGMPLVPPDATAEQVRALALELADRAQSLGATDALVSGEPTLTFALVEELERRGIRCHAATTARSVSERPGPDGRIERVSTYQFHSFRPYRPAPGA
ncbi:MAG: hypothetical protein NZ898_14415 [Myxococcota bacterium]|nr:hypothetical protein [Myxococcota bacterium]MDW8361646.1 hypothetical protein [Myxococcales bacterium]